MAQIRSFVWEPDPMVYAHALNEVADELHDRRAPLLAASETLRMDIRERFETETDPEGNKWKRWSIWYEDVAKGRRADRHGNTIANTGILDRTGALKEAATDSRAIRITNDTVFYQTSMLPHYGLLHEVGHEEYRGDQGGSLPRRSFLGLSDKAATVIFATFAEWFDGAVDLFVTTSGRLGMRHSLQGPGGFVSRASQGRGPLPRL